MGWILPLVCLNPLLLKTQASGRVRYSLSVCLDVSRCKNIINFWHLQGENHFLKSLRLRSYSERRGNRFWRKMNNHITYWFLSYYKTCGRKFRPQIVDNFPFSLVFDIKFFDVKISDSYDSQSTGDNFAVNYFDHKVISFSYIADS